MTEAGPGSAGGGGDVLRPETEEQVLAAVSWAISEEAPLALQGHGSKAAIGRPMQTAGRLDLSALAGVTLYEPDELVLSAQGRHAVAEIEAALAANSQKLAFEPTDYAPLLGGAPGRGTLGGLFAANLSGPRRIKVGAARDHLLGIRAVNGRGEIVKSGGRVVKNVTGYDLSSGLPAPGARSPSDRAHVQGAAARRDRGRRSSLSGLDEAGGRASDGGRHGLERRGLRRRASAGDGAPALHRRCLRRTRDACCASKASRRRCAARGGRSPHCSARPPGRASRRRAFAERSGGKSATSRPLPTARPARLAGLAGAGRRPACSSPRCACAGRWRRLLRLAGRSRLAALASGDAGGRIWCARRSRRCGGGHATLVRACRHARRRAGLSAAGGAAACAARRLRAAVRSCVRSSIRADGTRMCERRPARRRAAQPDRRSDHDGKSESGAVRRTARDRHLARGRPSNVKPVYILYLAGFVVGDHRPDRRRVRLSQPRQGRWPGCETHYTYQIRTFWIGRSTRSSHDPDLRLIGVLLMIALGVWVIAR